MKKGWQFSAESEAGQSREVAVNDHKRVYRY
jgi:hypothetical protein